MPIENMETLSQSPNGEYVACGTEASSDSATVLLFDVATGKLRSTFKGKNSPLYFQLGDYCHRFKLFQYFSFSFSHLGHALTVRSIAFSADSTKLVTGSDDKRIMIHDA